MMKKLPKLMRWMVSLYLMLLTWMSLYRCFFFFYYRSASRPFSGSAFLLGLRYDARFLSILCLGIIILASIPFLNPFRNKKLISFWAIFLTGIVCVFLVFYGADFYYYDYLKQRLNASVLNYFSDAAISLGMVWQTYPVLKIFIGLLLMLGLFFVWQKRELLKIAYDENEGLTKKYRVLTWIFVIISLIGLSFGRFSQYPLRWSDAFSFSDDFKGHTALNPFQSFFSSLQFRSSNFDIKKVRNGYADLSAYLGVQKADIESLRFESEFEFPDSGATRPNIVLVICESFSAYKSSMFGNHLNPTPYFNQLCDQGVFFERCFTPAFGTARGVWAVITGIPDVQQPKTSSRNPAAVDQHSIFNDFNDYEKMYFLGGSTTWANIRGVLKNNISDLKIYEQEDFKSAQVDVWGISDKNLFLEANKILSNQKKPFFAIIQTADNHRPYTIPQEDLNEFSKLEYPADTLKKYGFDDNGQFNAFRYADFNFKKFIEAAKKENYFNNTIFVFVGDHGLRGNAGNLFPKSFTQQGILAEHVPLLFYSPKLLQPQKIRRVCSQLDVMPSIATLARHSYTNTTLGLSLFNDTSKIRFAFIADPDLYSIGLVSDQYYFVKYLNSGKTSFVSVLDDNQIVSNAYTDSIKNSMASMANAWYETSKYMLLNNKKKNN